MAQDRVRIADVADSLGLSTATVSKVIHGNTEKISDETVKRVQQELERTGYIPNMAGILLARNNSRIIGVVVNDHVKLLLLCGKTAGITECLFAAYVFEWGIIGVYTLLTTEEIFRLAVSLAIFKKRKWMISLS